MTTTMTFGSSPVAYWEARARRFASQGAGLRAVCSYGMPSFYNAYIHVVQQRALAPWLDVGPESTVLDVGCGVGRWSRSMAVRGARVTGVDLSSTMVEQARDRAERAGLGERCRFLTGDLAELDLGQRFDLVVGVTVLQHVLDPERLRRAVDGLAAHLEPGGRVVLLEAAPSRGSTRCDSDVFHARSSRFYLDLLARAGLVPETVTGVDPAPFKVLYLPYYARLPRTLGFLGLAATTAASLPVDALFGRRWVGASWHKVFVLRRA